MIIKNIKIQHLRNIRQADLTLNPGINFIQGGNGAGKTTFLESIYLLARAKSFRQTHKNTLIEKGKESLLIFANTQSDKGESDKIGFKKQGNSNTVRINGQTVKKLSHLAARLPLAILTPHSHRIIEESPDHRRRLLNWGMFHVKHQHQLLLMNYNRTLSQRNAALKSSIQDPIVWDRQLESYANEITQSLKEYVDEWDKTLRQILDEIEIYDGLKLKFSQGWDKKYPLSEILKQKLKLDRKRGFTSAGPHRSDIEIKIKGNSARQQLSRGQQKYLLTAMMLAQSSIQQTRCKERAVVLYDDFQSELDSENQKSLLTIIRKSKCQAFVTIIEKENRDTALMDEHDAMFHVEHGQFSS